MQRCWKCFHCRLLRDSGYMVNPRASCRRGHFRKSYAVSNIKRADFERKHELLNCPDCDMGENNV